MRAYLNILLVSFSVSLFYSCEEVIKIDIDDAPSQLVIDGLITDEDTIHTVRISGTADFYGNGGSAISGAMVEVADNLGNTMNYTHNPEGIDSLDGTYFSDQKFAGITDRIYSLSVIVDNLTFTASDTLRPITSIDSLAVVVNPDAANDPESDGEIYQVILFAKEPRGA